MKNIKKQAFTLVELIVVIIVLVILGTIAFISLQGYSSSARDSKRLSDIQNIKKSLELFNLDTSKYPIPDDYQVVEYSGDDLRYQGIVGKQVITNLSKTLNNKPIDPLTELEYTYSITNNKTEYEILSVYESDLLSYDNNLLNITNAESQYFFKIDGTYNGVYVKSKNYYVPVPSIINSEVSGTGMILDNDNIKSQIITGGDNMISFGQESGETRQLSNFDLYVYNGELNEDSSAYEKKVLAETLQKAYSGTIFENQGIYKEIIASNGGGLLNLVDSLVLNSVEEKYEESSTGYVFSTGDRVVMPFGNSSWLEIGDVTYSSRNLNCEGYNCYVYEYNGTSLSIGNQIVMSNCPIGWLEVGDVTYSSRDVSCGSSVCKVCQYNGVDLTIGDRIVMSSCPIGWLEVGDVTYSSRDVSCGSSVCKVCEYQ